MEDLDLTRMFCASAVASVLGALISLSACGAPLRGFRVEQQLSVCNVIFIIGGRARVRQFVRAREISVKAVSRPTQIRVERIVARLDAIKTRQQRIGRTEENTAELQ